MDGDPLRAQSRPGYQRPHKMGLLKRPWQERDLRASSWGFSQGAPRRQTAAQKFVAIRSCPAATNGP